MSVTCSVQPAGAPIRLGSSLISIGSSAMPTGNSPKAPARKSGEVFLCALAQLNTLRTIDDLRHLGDFFYCWILHRDVGVSVIFG